MKILHVIASMNPTHGGVCQAVRSIIAGTTELGVMGEVVSLDSPSDDFIAKDTFKTYAMGPAVKPWAYSKLLIPWLAEHLSRFDVVVIHGLWLYHGYAVRKLLDKLRKSGKPCPRSYVMPHGMLDPYFQKAGSRRVKAIRNWIYWKLIEGSVVNKADGLLFTCEEEKLLARKTFRPYSVRNEHVVGLGVESPPAYGVQMKQAFAEKCPELGEQPYLLFLSRIHHKKGVDLLIRAYAQLAKEHQTKLVSSSPTAHCSLPTSHLFPHIVIAGPLDSPYAAEMQALAKELLPHYSSIHFPGMLQGAAKWGAFYGCEAFVLPSHQENFGIAVVEALACGQPVLISNKVNIWREIESYGAGIVADDSLAGTLLLMEGFFRNSSCEFAARACYLKFFGVHEAAEKFREAIRETNLTRY